MSAGWFGDRQLLSPGQTFCEGLFSGCESEVQIEVNWSDHTLGQDPVVLGHGKAAVSLWMFMENMPFF